MVRLCYYYYNYANCANQFIISNTITPGYTQLVIYTIATLIINLVIYYTNYTNQSTSLITLISLYHLLINENFFFFSASASSSRTPATPVVHYHRVTPSQSPRRSSVKRNEGDSVLSISYSSRTSEFSSFSSLMRNEDLSSQDLFDGASMAEEFGESSR